MKVNKLIISFILLTTFVSCSGRQAEFNQYVMPMAVTAIKQNYRNNADTYKKAVLGACAYYAESAERYGKDVKPFSDDECFKYMVNEYPNLKKYLTK